MENCCEDTDFVVNIFIFKLFFKMQSAVVDDLTVLSGITAIFSEKEIWAERFEKTSYLSRGA